MSHSGNGSDEGALREKAKKYKVQFLSHEEEEDSQVVAKHDTVRRQTRTILHDLNEKIDENQDGLQELANESWQTTLEMLNETHAGISHTREAQYDAMLMAKLSTSMRKRARKLEQSSVVNYRDFLTCLRDHYAIGHDGESNRNGDSGNSSSSRRKKGREADEGYREEKGDDDEQEENATPSSKRRARSHNHGASLGDVRLDWAALGCDIAPLFLSPVGISTMLGPISKPVKVRKEAAPRKVYDKNMQVEEPENIRAVAPLLEGEDPEEGELGEATFERIHRMETFLKSICVVGDNNSATGSSSSSSSAASAAAASASADLLKILIDPSDAIQTIENFFDFAFLIKNGDVVTKFDKSSVELTVVSANKELIERTLPKRQHVLTLGMRDLAHLSDLMLQQEDGDGREDEDEDGDRDREGDGKGRKRSISASFASTSTSSQSFSQSQHSGSGKQSSKFNPLHRRDPIYAASTALDQNAVLDEQNAAKKAKQLARMAVSQGTCRRKADKSNKKTQ